MRRFQFSIPTLITLTVFVSIACALGVWAAEYEEMLKLRRAAQEEESQKARVEYLRELIKRRGQQSHESP